MLDLTSNCGGEHLCYHCYRFVITVIVFYVLCFGLSLFVAKQYEAILGLATCVRGALSCEMFPLIVIVPLIPSCVLGILVLYVFKVASLACDAVAEKEETLATDM